MYSPPYRITLLKGKHAATPPDNEEDEASRQRTAAFDEQREDRYRRQSIVNMNKDELSIFSKFM